VLLDRLLDSAGIEVVPVAVCDVRRGVRVELPALAEPHLHCIVRGIGTLRGASGLALPVEPGGVAIVPSRTPHGVEPQGEARRVLQIGSAVSSDHVPALTAGGGEPGLVVVSGRIRAVQGDTLGLFDRMLTPLVVSLADVPRIQPMFETLLEEQAGRAPGSRRMTALVMQQALMHALRKLCGEPASGLPWLSAIREPGLSRALGGMLRAPSTPHSVKSLAATAGMGRATFSQKFSQAFGQSPIGWLNHIRMQEAIRLLHTTDLPLEAIAARVGLTGGSPAFRQLRTSMSYGSEWQAGDTCAAGSASRRSAPRGYSQARSR
jgi:AraC family transcriptional regulator, activator of mtrCDE